jgi:3-oxoacyl-[acyl-carrier-protein] synthase II
MAVISFKGRLVLCVCAAGAVELLATLFAACWDYVPPTHGLEVSDPACDLDYVPGVGRQMPVDLALSISVGMGGGNAAIIVRGDKPAGPPPWLTASA